MAFVAELMKLEAPVAERRRVLVNRSRYRGTDDYLERVNTILSTWADEVRTRPVLITGTLGTLAIRVGGPMLEISEQSGLVDKILCSAHRNAQIAIFGYYRFGWPVEAIARNLRPTVRRTAVREHLDTYRRWVGGEMERNGWRV